MIELITWQKEKISTAYLDHREDNIARRIELVTQQEEQSRHSIDHRVGYITREFSIRCDVLERHVAMALPIKLLKTHNDIKKLKLYFGKCFWLSWQSGCF